MTEQPSFFDPVSPARRTDPETSHAAARTRPRGRLTDRQRALDLIRAAGPAGLTDFELAARMNRQQTSAGKRRGELVDAGLVRFAGIWRDAPSGAKARVWVARP